MMEQLKESDVSEDELSDVDREMINRFNATEDGQLVGRVENVKMSSKGARDTAFIEAKTPVGNKGDHFTLPDTPTDEDDIVRLCKANGVDPRYPSMLEGCDVKWDDSGDIVIPVSRRKRLSEWGKEKLTNGRWTKPKLLFFYAFLPITLTTYYLTIERRSRHPMKQEPVDFAFQMAIWCLGVIMVGFICLLILSVFAKVLA